MVNNGSKMDKQIIILIVNNKILGGKNEKQKDSYNF